MKTALYPIVIGGLLCCMRTFAWGATHPCIWTAAADRPVVLERIRQSGGLTHLVAARREAVDESINNHVADPKAFIGRIPAPGGDPRGALLPDAGAEVRAVFRGHPP